MPQASPSNSEWLTRKRLIDGKLAAAGWKVVPASPGAPITKYNGCAVEEFETATGPADYALVLDGTVVGVVEAKKLTLGPQNVLSQAERYSRSIDQPSMTETGFGVPFLYATNGEVIWYHDVRHPLSRSRRVAAFHTPDALGEQLRRDFNRATAAVIALPNDGPRLRPYQRDANAAIEQALADRKREMLVAMATGTGKTFTMVNDVYRLMKTDGRRAPHPLSRGPARACRASRARLQFVRSRARPEVRQDLRCL
jgi:type I restriction enzyme R subunit